MKDSRFMRQLMSRLGPQDRYDSASASLAVIDGSAEKILDYVKPSAISRAVRRVGYALRLSNPTKDLERMTGRIKTATTDLTREKNQLESRQEQTSATLEEAVHLYTKQEAGVSILSKQIEAYGKFLELVQKGATPEDALVQVSGVYTEEAIPEPVISEEYSVALSAQRAEILLASAKTAQTIIGKRRDLAEIEMRLAVIDMEMGKTSRVLGALERMVDVT